MATLFENAEALNVTVRLVMLEAEVWALALPVKDKLTAVLETLVTTATKPLGTLLTETFPPETKLSPSVPLKVKLVKVILMEVPTAPVLEEVSAKLVPPA